MKVFVYVTEQIDEGRWLDRREVSNINADMLMSKYLAEVRPFYAGHEFHFCQKKPSIDILIRFFNIFCVVE